MNSIEIPHGTDLRERRVFSSSAGQDEGTDFTHPLSHYSVNEGEWQSKYSDLHLNPHLLLTEHTALYCREQKRREQMTVSVAADTRRRRDTVSPKDGNKILNYWRIANECKKTKRARASEIESSGSAVVWQGRGENNNFISPRLPSPSMDGVGRDGMGYVRQ